MKVTWKITMTNWDVFYKVNWTTDWCYDPDLPKRVPVKAISQDMYDWKKDMLPVVWLFDSIIKRLAVSSSEIINIEED